MAAGATVQSYRRDEASEHRRSLRVLTKNTGSLLGLVLVASLCLLCLIVPLTDRYRPLEMNPAYRLQPPSAQYWLGTDLYGRDIFSRIIGGTRVSLTVGFVSVGLASLVGLVLGLISGYYKGWVDSILMRITDIFMTLPTLLIAVAVMAIFQHGLTSLILALALSFVAPITRVARAGALVVSEMPYVEAARAAGASPWRIMAKHMLRNIVPTIIVLATFFLATAIIVEASLSYLGLGLKPPAPSLGGMVAEGQNYLFTTPRMALIPSAVLALLVLGFNLVGDGIRDVLDAQGLIKE